MIQAKCIQKFRDKNNHIYGYRLQDQAGKQLDVNTQQLKSAIANKQINIINLKLTSDNRLVSCEISNDNNSEKAILTRGMIKDNYRIHAKRPNGLVKTIDGILMNKHIYFKSNIDINTFNNLKTFESKQFSDDIIACIEPNNKDKVLIASTKQITLEDYNNSPGCGMFGEMHIKSIDLRGVDTSLVTNFWELFSNCYATHYNLDGIDMSNGHSYEYMFYRSYAEHISMKGVKINDNANTEYMFGEMGDFELDTDSSLINEAYKKRVI